METDAREASRVLITGGYRKRGYNHLILLLKKGVG